MAVYTDVSEEELCAFLASYDLGDLLSFKGIAEGVENSNFLLHTNGGRYILTLYEKRVAREDLPFFLGLMEHLSKKGITCPLPVRNKKGDALGELCGRPAAIITFLDGVWPRRPQVHHCTALGKVLAQFHKAAADFKLERKNALGPSGWRKLADTAGMRANTVYHGLSGIIADEMTHLSKAWPGALPGGVIHADLFPDNVFFIGEKLSGVIDFYFACNDLLAYDLAICLNAWCFEADGSYNVTKGKALLSAYDEERKLSADERNALPLLARSAALRFLLTRLVDWLDVPPGALVRPKDPLEYLRKLRFHQRVDSAGDYGLVT